MSHGRPAEQRLARSSLRAIAPALSIVALAFTALGCPDTLGQLCPVGAQQAGLFNVTLAFNANDTGQCYYSDGGPDASFDTSLAVTNPDAGPETFSAAICSSLNSDGGAPLLYFAVAADVRGAPLSNGVFTYQAPDASDVIGTPCGCDILVNETISFTVDGLSDAAVAIDQDGGLPPITSFNGTVVDQVAIAPEDDAGTCFCNLPCDLQYTISGTAL